MVEGFYGKRVIVTGSTGFKGSWLCAWLEVLGAEVFGIGLLEDQEQSLHGSTSEKASTRTIVQDVRDLEALRKLIDTIQPDYVFHMAAQALVRKSYKETLLTWSTNVIGTVNVLECLRHLDKICVSVFITSDKAYQNKEWVWGYRENDRKEGDDPYSASKSCADIAISSYTKTILNHRDNIRVGIARAGNVIGGGDWSADRIVPDCIRAWLNGEVVELRKPRATRPWQHVLEPIHGYLTLASQMATNQSLDGEAFNFGPKDGVDRTVEDLVGEVSRYWKGGQWRSVDDRTGPNECGLLRLNCDKAKALLGWSGVLSFEETAQLTAEWYVSYSQGEDPRELIDKDITRYSQVRRGMV